MPKRVSRRLSKRNANLVKMWACKRSRCSAATRLLVRPAIVANMTVLNIKHRTTYRYRTAVSLGPHRLLLRPRESRDVRLVSYELTITPRATVAWAYDVFGNAVASAVFQGQTDQLEIISSARLELAAVPWPIFDIAASAITYPFRYSGDDWTDLGSLVIKQYPDQSLLLRNWAQGFVASEHTDTLSLLKDLSGRFQMGVV